jgi:hypothetical protein
MQDLLTCMNKPVKRQFKVIDTDFSCQTLEGITIGKAGDCLVVGVDGEVYPCDKKIFDDINRYIYRGDFKKRETAEYNRKETFDIGFNVIFEEDKKNLLHIKELKYLLGKNSIILKLNYSKNELTSLTINRKQVLTISDNIKFIDRGDFNLDFFCSNSERRISLERYISEKIRIFVENLTKEFSTSITTDNNQQHNKLKELLSSVLNMNKEQLDKLIADMTPNEELAMLSKFGEINNENQDKIENKTIQIQSIKILEDSLILDKLQNEIFKSLDLIWTKRTQKFIEIKNLVILYNFIDKFILPISNYFRQTFINVKYIAPLRATAERFYRIKHLSVNEVDQNGTNLPSFLDSLTDSQIKEFQNWTKENFNFFVKISKLGGHYSIKISLKDGIDINLSDMGFGYSQILPILTQLWYSSTRYDRNRRIGLSNIQKIIVIEQPELHLHPEFQAKFTNMLAEVLKYANSNTIDLRIIIETHSDILVNRLGDLIIDDKIKANQINILIFDKESEEQPTNISLANYDNEGNLLNWPLGFFQPSL